jgi:hypothetical protein
VATAKQVLEKSVVVFSENYLPLCWVNIKRAIVLLITNKAKPLLGYTEDEWRVHSPNLIVDVPKYIRLEVAAIERATKLWIDVQANLE